MIKEQNNPNYKQSLDEAFLISRIIKVEVRVISRSRRLRLITKNEIVSSIHNSFSISQCSPLLCNFNDLVSIHLQFLLSNISSQRLTVQYFQSYRRTLFSWQINTTFASLERRWSTHERPLPASISVWTVAYLCRIAKQLLFRATRLNEPHQRLHILKRLG